MSELISLVTQRLSGYVQNNLVDFAARSALSIVGLLLPSSASTDAFQTFLRGMFESPAGSFKPEEDMLHYSRLVEHAVGALPVVMSLAVGAALLFMIMARGVAVVAIEGPQLRPWSRRLFRAGFVLAMGFAVWLLPPN